MADPLRFNHREVPAKPKRMTARFCNRWRATAGVNLGLLRALNPFYEKVFPFHEKLFHRFEKFPGRYISSRRRDGAGGKPLKLTVETGPDLRQERVQVAERHKLP
jgi:hypothetical protein